MACPCRRSPGALDSQPAGLTGVLHADATTGCSTVTDPISVTGNTDSKGITTLTGPVAGGTLTITGTLASDGRSLTNATVTCCGRAVRVCDGGAGVGAELQLGDRIVCRDLFGREGTGDERDGEPVAGAGRGLQRQLHAEWNGEPGDKLVLR